MVKTALFLSSSEYGYANTGQLWKFTRVFSRGPKCKILTAPWTKNSQVQKQVLKWGIFSGLGKGRKGTGVETRSFNSSFDGHSTSSSYVERRYYGPRFLR